MNKINYKKFIESMKKYRQRIKESESVEKGIKDVNKFYKCDSFFKKYGYSEYIIDSITENKIIYLQDPENLYLYSIIEFIFCYYLILDNSFSYISPDNKEDITRCSNILKSVTVFNSAFLNDDIIYSNSSMSRGHTRIIRITNNLASESLSKNQKEAIFCNFSKNLFYLIIDKGNVIESLYNILNLYIISENSRLVIISDKSISSKKYEIKDKIIVV